MWGWGGDIGNLGLGHITKMRDRPSKSEIRLASNVRKIASGAMHTIYTNGKRDMNYTLQYINL